MLHFTLLEGAVHGQDDREYRDIGKESEPCLCHRPSEVYFNPFLDLMNESTSEHEDVSDSAFVSHGDANLIVGGCHDRDGGARARQWKEARQGSLEEHGA